LISARRAWHEAKLAELQETLEIVRRTGGRPGPERTLVAGISYHRKMLEMLDELAPY
jgi:hypothetical protein